MYHSPDSPIEDKRCLLSPLFDEADQKVRQCTILKGKILDEVYNEDLQKWRTQTI